MPRSVTTLTCVAEKTWFASTNRVLTFDVMYESFERIWRSLLGPTTSSLWTRRTFGVFLARLPIDAQVPWSGTSPVSSTMPL